MESFPNDLGGQIRLIFSEIADIKRRAANKKRDGVVSDLDIPNGVAKVKLSDGYNGKPFETDWIPWTELAAGAIKTSFSPSIGEQVSVRSESGDLTDAIIDFSSPSNANPRPHNGAEAVLTYGDSRFEIGSDINASATKNISISGTKISLVGDVEITGTIRCNGVDIGDTHRHANVATGVDLSGVPTN